MALIEYADKVSDRGQTANGKFFSDDANEIKEVVNENAEVLSNLGDVVLQKAQPITISQIRSLTGELDYSQYFITDDNRFGNAYYDATDTTTADNNITVYVTSDGKRIKRFVGDFISAEWVGLDKTGTTDMSAKLQSVVDLAYTEKKVVVAGNGICRVNSPVIIKVDELGRKVGFIGIGGFSISMGANNTHAFILGDDSYIGDGNKGYGIAQVAGVNFIENGKTGCIAINVKGQKQINISDIYASGGISEVLRLKSVYASSVVENVRINGNKSGVKTGKAIVSYGQVNNIVFRRCQLLACEYAFYADPTSGAGMASGELDTVTFDNCDIEGNTNGIYIDSPFGCSSLVISDCHFENNDGNELIVNNYTSTNTSVNISGVYLNNNKFQDLKGLQVGNNNLGGDLLGVGVYGNTFTGLNNELIRIGTECQDKAFNIVIDQSNNYSAPDGIDLLKKGISLLSVKPNLNGASGVMGRYDSPNLPFGYEDAKGLNGDIRMSSTQFTTKGENGHYFAPLGKLPENIQTVRLAEWGYEAPTTGAWVKGERVNNILADPGVYIGWVCVTSGTPGNWKGFGLIQS